MKEFDVLIVGAGPIGLSCAIAAKEAGLSHVVIDKGAIVNSIFNYPLFMRFFSTSDRLEIGNVPFMCLAPKPGREEALEYYRTIATFKQLNIHLYENVLTINKQVDNNFHVQTSKELYQARNVVIATGFYDIPMYLNVPGEELSKVRHYYKEPHEYALQNVIVVGASNSSVDAALETWHKGANVTMVIRGEAVGARVKYWVKPNIENRIAEGSINAHYESHITAIRQDEVDIATPEGNITIPNDYVLALTGYRPNFEFLNACGVQMDGERKKPHYNEATMETNISGLYLAGVVCGGLDTHLWFIENSRDHAGKIVAHITEKSPS